VNAKGYSDIKYLQVESYTDAGKVRPHNEDSHRYFIPDSEEEKDRRGSLFVVSDGVGGSNAGEVASAEAVNVLLLEYYFGEYPEQVPERLKNAVQHTAMHIYDLSSTYTSMQNMKCTLSALLINSDKFYIAHVGDSKIFLLRAGKMTQLTKDHSLVSKLSRLGLLSDEEAMKHPGKHILLKALGDRPIIPADFYSGRIMPGDVFCLVTDGILEHTTVDELNSLLIGNTSSDMLSEETSGNRLQQIVELLNERGGYDNMTIMTVKVNTI